MGFVGGASVANLANTETGGATSVVATVTAALMSGFGVAGQGVVDLYATTFTPLSLFADGSQGAWYDNSNMSTLFQDSAGTTPAVLESPVGKQLDLSGRGNHRSQATSANRPLLSARYNLLTATATLATQSITTVATSYTIYFTGAGTVTLSGTFIGVFTAGTNTFTATAGTLTATVVGSVLTADIRPTNQTVTLPAYQSVTSSSVYDTTGFPQYLKYNGTAQYLSTASVDFTATAQMSVFAGVRKNSLGSAIGVIAELSAQVGANAGSFLLSSGGYASLGSKYGCALQGSTLIYSDSSATFIVPITNTLSTLMSIQAATPALQQILNINGVQQTVTQVGSGAGTGNFGNYALYFGERAGSSLAFNGLEFQMIIVGKTLTAAQITNTETYVNQKTKAY